jgi:hypothetical protein
MEVVGGKDNMTEASVSDNVNLFDECNGCAIATSIPTLPSGSFGRVYGNSFVYDPGGHKMTVTNKLCTEVNLNGFA